MHATIINYFAELNAKLKDFPEKSFFRMDLMEITGAFRSGINFPAMTVESPDIEADGSINNSVIGRVFAFTVYVNPTQGDFDGQNSKLDQAERIGWKLIARMRHDARDPNHFLYNKFQVNEVRATKVGPIFTEQLHGYRFTGTIKGTESLKVDPADWSDNPVC